MKLPLDGKAVFVSGGSAGVCRLQTEVLISLGANACIVGRSAEYTERAADEIRRDCQRKGMVRKIVLYSGVDVREIQQVRRVVNQAMYEFGTIDIVISGAASAYLQDYNHISSDNWNTLETIDNDGCTNLVVAFGECGFHGRFIRMDCTLHRYGIPFKRNLKVNHYMRNLKNIEHFNFGNSNEILQQTLSPYITRVAIPTNEKNVLPGYEVNTRLYSSI